MNYVIVYSIKYCIFECILCVKMSVPPAGQHFTYGKPALSRDSAYANESSRSAKRMHDPPIIFSSLTT